MHTTSENKAKFLSFSEGKVPLQLYVVLSVNYESDTFLDLNWSKFPKIAKIGIEKKNKWRRIANLFVANSALSNPLPPSVIFRHFC